jgi:hypothetical protein
MPGQQILRRGNVIVEFWRADAPKRMSVTGSSSYIRAVVAVLLPGDEIVGDPEINVRSFVAFVSHEIEAAVVTFGDGSMAVILGGYGLPIVEQSPVQAIEADGIVEASVVPFHHMREQVSFILVLGCLA